MNRSRVHSLRSGASLGPSQRACREAPDRRREERGATLVEAALVYPLLFLLLFGIVEFGLAFKDYLTVSHAARDGARAGATYGNNPAADILILEDVHRALSTVGMSDGIQVKIFNPLGGTGTSTTYRYQPNEHASCDWVPCPDPRLSSPPYVKPTWDPLVRDVTAPFTDRIAVEVTYTHQWITGFILDETDFTAEADFLIEPQVFNP